MGICLRTPLGSIADAFDETRAYPGSPPSIISKRMTLSVLSRRKWAPLLRNLELNVEATASAAGLRGEDHHERPIKQAEILLARIYAPRSCRLDHLCDDLYLLHEYAPAIP
jgi:hypothetical protein